MERLLSEEFLSQYGDSPSHMNQLAQFVFYRTYSRWLKDKNRRETFKEAITRAVEYNTSIQIDEFKRNNFNIPLESIRREAEVLFDNIFNLRQFLSGRTHWVGGADTAVAKKFPLSNFNCSFLQIEKWSDIGELFYLLLVGTGVGFSSPKGVVEGLAPIRRNYKLEHSKFKPVPTSERLEGTKLNFMDNGYAKIYVGDSKEAWVTALNTFLMLVTDKKYDEVHTIKISYNSIRPKGERLKTFGGTASGYEPLRDMFIGIDKVFKDELDKTLEPMEEEDNKYKVRPIHILDIGNLIGNNVVVGGVRRTAEIFLADEDDYEVIFAKYGLNGFIDEKKHQELGQKLHDLDILPSWWSDKEMLEHKATLWHRHMSNNSIAFQKKPTKQFLNTVFTIMQSEGEPGFINMEEALRRRPNAKGINPCAEILLDSKQVCNLTTVNIMAFVEDGQLAFGRLMEAQSLSVRAGIRMTCINLELDDWDELHKRDRLIGVSLTGWKDAMEALQYTAEQEKQLLTMLADVANQECVAYSYILRIPTPLLDTTVKPEGTLSQVANGVSSGLHVSHAPYYIRRVRINASDPLAETVLELGWDVLPENNTPGDTLEEKYANAKTLVVEFPVKSPSTKTRDNQTLKEQLDTYFMFQEYYSAHNSSNTISVKDGEWQEVENVIFEKWDDFVGVSFLAYNGGSYDLMPYEECTEEEYNRRKDRMKGFDISLLNSIEENETEQALADDCDT